MDIGNDIRQAVTKYSDMLYRICIVILCNEQDVQDAIQDTFCRYLEKAPDFHDEEHEKAWLIRVATNICRDMVRFQLRQKTVIYLHYVEGYQIKEIAEILGITEGAVKMRLCRAREQMRLTWGSG